MGETNELDAGVYERCEWERKMTLAAGVYETSDNRCRCETNEIGCRCV